VMELEEREWAIERAQDLMIARQRAFGGEAFVRLSDAEKDACIAQATKEAIQRTERKKLEVAEAARVAQFRQREEDRKAGKLTLRATLGEMISRRKVVL
jgi:hypothetical protein